MENNNRLGYAGGIIVIVSVVTIFAINLINGGSLFTNKNEIVVTKLWNTGVTNAYIQNPTKDRYKEFSETLSPTIKELKMNDLNGLSEEDYTILVKALESSGYFEYKINKNEFKNIYNILETEKKVSPIYK